MVLSRPIFFRNIIDLQNTLLHLDDRIKFIKHWWERTSGARLAEVYDETIVNSAALSEEVI